MPISGAPATMVKSHYATTVWGHLLTTLISLSGYWYHTTATSGTTKLLHMVPQKCYSGTTRVILSILRFKTYQRYILLQIFNSKITNFVLEIKTTTRWSDIIH